MVKEGKAAGRQMHHSDLASNSCAASRSRWTEAECRYASTWVGCVVRNTLTRCDLASTDGDTGATAAQVAAASKA